MSEPGQTELRIQLREDAANRDAAEWLVHVVGFPIDFSFPKPPEPLWQAVIDCVHRDKTGRLHGNQVDREYVAEWLEDEVRPRVEP